MLAKNMAMPRYITFSGTGSKILRILTPENQIIEAFTRLIFERIYGHQYGDDGLTIIRNEENPKEATCKGGLCNPVNQSYSSIDEIKAILIGTDCTSFVDNNIKYKSISDNDLDSIVREIRIFLDFFFSLNDVFSFSRRFGAEINNLSEIKSLCTRDIRLYLRDGYNNKQQELALIDSDQPIEETLFFYPLVGLINSLVRNIRNL